MRNILIFIATMLLLQGCVNSTPPMSISLKQTSSDEFVFSSDRCLATIPAKYIASQSDSGRLYVRRYFFQADNSILTLEKLGLDRDFRFSVGLNSVIYAGFEFKNYTLENIGTFHTYFEGLDRGGNEIYVLASGVGVFNDIDIIYSSSKEIIKKLSDCVQSGSAVDFSNLKNDSQLTLSKSDIKSDWSARTTFKYSIITSDRDDRRFPD